MKKWVFILMTITLVSFSLMTTANASDLVVREDLGKHFENFSSGTFVMYDESKDQYSIFNTQQSEKRLTPCSTFKIYNSLIALETGVAPDENMMLLWDGQQHSLPIWNQDHTMASAIKNSVIWYYQELASRIGSERMQKYIDIIPYGNRDISGGITQFWLGSSLKISAKEQVELLRRLFHDQLPFSASNLAIGRKIIIQSEEKDVVLSGKTGSSSIEGVYSVGWFIGVVEKDNGRYYFATNLEAKNGANGIKARNISQDILKSLGVL